MRFVIVGSGNIAHTYVIAIEKTGNEVAGIVSRKSIKPALLSHLLFFESLEVVNIDFDAVIICTPNGTHHVYAIEAARLGKHVLCEKPLEICLEWADAMIKACREHNVKLGVAYQRRFSSDNPLVKNLIDKGMLGRIFSVNLSVLNYRNNSYYQSAPYRGTRSLDGGGPFIQQASHYIDLYYWYFDKPEKINAYLGTFIHDIEVEDHGAVICRHSSGLISTITASTATKPGFPARLEIYSDKGYLVMENDVITRWEIEGLENPTVHTKSENQHTGSSSAIVNDTTNHERIINDFTDAVLNDREPLVNGEEARHATEIILEIYKNC